MIRVYNVFWEKKLHSKLILQVHDELIVDTVPEELETVKEILQEQMEHVCQMAVPLKVHTAVGKKLGGGKIMRYVIGLTGGIACGKSSVSAILAALGAEILDADRIGHEVLKKGQAAYADVVAEFGRQILDGREEIDRKILGPIVFSDSKNSSG